jgi:hypothetical protein
MNLGPQSISITLEADQDDLDSPTYSFGTIIELIPASGGSDLTGIKASRFSDGDTFFLINTDDTDSITLKHSDSGSIEANRFKLPGSADVVIRPRGGVMVTYDSTLGFLVPLSNVTPTTVGNVADAEVDPAEIAPGIPYVITHVFEDAATATYEFLNADKIEIIDAWVIKDAAGAANTLQVTDSADAAITNAMIFAVDKTLVRAGTIDVAKRVLAAAAGYKVVNTRAAGSSAGSLFLLVVKRA